MNVNNTEISDCKTISNAMNDYFANIGPKLTEKIPNGCNVDATNDYKRDHVESSTSVVNNSFRFKHV